MDNTEDKYPKVQLKVEYGTPKDPGEFPIDGTDDDQIEWTQKSMGYNAYKLCQDAGKVKFDD